ncbi:hypothetical protein ABGS11_004187 [Escherichia coli]
MPDQRNKELTASLHHEAVEEIADELRKRCGSDEAALALLSMTAFTMMLRCDITDMQNMRADGKGLRMSLTGFDDETGEEKHCTLH